MRQSDDPPKKLFVKILLETDELEEFLARNPGAKISFRADGKPVAEHPAKPERRKLPDRRNPPAARKVHMDRFVEVLGRQDVGLPGDDGLTARLRCRIEPEGSEHVFEVTMSYSVGSMRKVSKSPTGPDRERAFRLLQAAAVRRIEDDPRKTLPAEDQFAITRDDLARVPANI